MSEQAYKVRNEAVPQGADGLYSDKGTFDEAVVYYGGEGVHLQTKNKDNGTVGFAYVTLGKVTGN